VRFCEITGKKLSRDNTGARIQGLAIRSIFNEKHLDKPTPITLEFLNISVKSKKVTKSVEAVTKQTTL